MPGCKEKLQDLVMSTAKKIYGDPLDKEILDRINAELTGIFSKGYEVMVISPKSFNESLEISKNLINRKNKMIQLQADIEKQWKIK